MHRTVLLIGAAYLVLTARPRNGAPEAPAFGGVPYDLLTDGEFGTPAMPVPSWQTAPRPPLSECRPCPPGLVCTMQCITDAPLLGVVAA